MINKNNTNKKKNEKKEKTHTTTTCKEKTLREGGGVRWDGTGLSSSFSPAEGESRISGSLACLYFPDGEDGEGWATVI